MSVVNEVNVRSENGARRPKYTLADRGGGVVWPRVDGGARHEHRQVALQYIAGGIGAASESPGC